MYFHEINFLLEAYESYKYERASKKTLAQIEKMKDERDANQNQGDEVSRADLDAEMNLGNCKSKFNKLKKQSVETLNSPKYELIQNMATLLNCACIIILQENTDHPISLMQNWMIL